MSLQQRADAHFIVGIGALEAATSLATRVSSSPARAIARSTPSPIAATSRGSPDDRHHRVGGRTFRLGEADRDLRHRLRDHAHFLARQARLARVEQHDGAKNKAARPARTNTPPLWPIAACSEATTQLSEVRSRPARPRRRSTPSCKRRGRGGPSGSLQNLSDSFAIVVGGAARAARLVELIERLTVWARARVELRVRIILRRRRNGRRRQFAAHRISVAVDVDVADVERLLNGGKRDFGGIFDLLGLFAMFSLSPLTVYASG